MMQAHLNTAHENGNNEAQSSRLRFRIYWITSVFSIIVFLIFMYAAVMGQYPRGQYPPVAGLWMCSISGVLSGVSLAVGFWKFRTSDAPVTVWPLGPLLGIPVALEFGLSAIGIYQMIGRLI
ncbi:MAG: hypothetical protein ABI286_11590 [Edaphobacter sp.]